MADGSRQFRAKVEAGPRGRTQIRLPFDPDEAWGAKERHHITGTVNGVKVRGPLATQDGAFVLSPGPAWWRDSGIGLGDEVTVELAPEGPQREALADDLQAALDAEPLARAFFDALPTFYRKAYLSWVDATKRRPDVRAERIRELTELLKAGKKER